MNFENHNTTFNDDLEQEFAEGAYLHAKAHDLGVDDDELEDLIASRGAFGITDEDLEELADEELAEDK